MRKLNKGNDNSPIIAYYQFKQPEKAHPKVRVLTKGLKIQGTYEHTFVDEEGGYKNHLIKTAEGKITVKGATSLNSSLENVKRGTEVLIEFLGVGKKKPGRRPPYLFDVYDLTPEGQVVAEQDDADEDLAAADVDAIEVAEEDSDEIPF